MKPLEEDKGWEKEVHEMVQNEVAGEMWYESRQNEDRLQKLLSNLEVRITSLLHSQSTRLVERLRLCGEYTGNLKLGFTESDQVVYLSDAISLIKGEDTVIEHPLSSDEMQQFNSEMTDCEHDFENAIRKGRASYECPKCHRDISLEWYLVQGAFKPTVPYNQVDHSHCWAQKQPPACGIPLEIHKVCCLCELPVRK